MAVKFMIRCTVSRMVLQMRHWNVSLFSLIIENFDIDDLVSNF